MRWAFYIVGGAAVVGLVWWLYAKTKAAAAAPNKPQVYMKMPGSDPLGGNARVLAEGAARLEIAPNLFGEAGYGRSTFEADVPTKGKAGR